MQRIDECKTVLGTMGCRLTPEQVIQNDATQDVPVLMLANKQDVPGRAAGSDAGALKLHEIKEVFNKIAVRLEARDSRVLLVSALTGEGVKEAVEWLHSRLILNKDLKPPTYTNK
ncbi:ADP-ribosylation factor protein 3 [Kappamyces sp. JEL0680]|nr:ADP-ribosylation factor protein 3 [Kappamyces sp. JEL0680]